MIVKETLNDFIENYSKVRKLLDEDSKHDPDTEPYASKYAARAILFIMKHSLSNLIEDECQPCQKNKLEAMLGVVFLNIGVIDMETEEIAASEQVFTDSISYMEEKSLQPEFIITLLNIYNNLGILWSNRDDTEKSKFYLTKSKELYNRFKSTSQSPVCMEQLFTDNDTSSADGDIALERAHTLTLYYLAQVYGTLNENLKSAVYCHITLKRQLQYGDYDPIDWALNAATLSQFFAEHNGFLQSRHHLAAASAVLQEHERKLLAEETRDEAYDARVEIYKHRSADVSRCWAKYCLMLLTSSRERLMSDNESSSAVTDLSNLTIEEGDEDTCRESIKSLFFSGIDVSLFENEITHQYLLTFDDARKVFLSCQNWLNKAKEYYRLDSLASDYCEIVQDHSQAFSYLVFFEEDDERQAKMQKKRVNMLEELLKEINPTYYLQYCRQLWYELGEVYSDILNIKLDKLAKISERPSPQALLKINTLAEQSISNFENFLKSLNDTTTKKMPVKLDSDVIRPVVTAYALIGRNNMKKISPDKEIQLINVTKSYEAYKAVVDYCKGDEDAAKLMHETFGLCEEMVSILPLKIRKIESEMISQ